MKRQATKANPADVDLHIRRQRKYGSRMRRDMDMPHWGELLITGLVLALMMWGAF